MSFWTVRAWAAYATAPGTGRPDGQISEWDTGRIQGFKGRTTVGGRYLTEDKLVKIRALNKMAGERGQSLAQMALAWVLRRKEVTSVLIGASSTAQLEDNAKALDSPAFSCEELADIEGILKGVTGSGQTHIQKWRYGMNEKLNYEVGDIVKLKRPIPAAAASGKSSGWELISGLNAWGADIKS